MTKNNLPILPVDVLAASMKTGYINQSERTFKHYDVFIDGEIGEPSTYRDLIALLFNANEEDSILIFFNSGGGHLDTAVAIVEGLKTTDAHATAVILGACHSAASIIAMYCHDVIVTDSAYSMVHTASFGSSGNTGNVKAHTEFTVKQVEKLLNDTYEGFLTKEELLKVKSGVELWFDADEIRTRVKSRAKFLEAKRKKEKKAKGDTNEAN